MRIAFLSCHLTGTGHLVRTLALARAARRLGHHATVISGGRPLDHIEAGGVSLVQLPPVGVRGFEFARLRQPDGAPVSDAYMVERHRILSETLAGVRPHALVTELYPFGRRVLGAEFGHAIAATRSINPGAAVVASVRDVPEPKPARLAETAARIEADYDAVLVHGDARFLPLSASWPLPEALAPRIYHVGYVGAGDDPPSAQRTATVVVAVGGGVLGRRLLETAVEAARLSHRPWHVLVGGADAAELSRRLGSAGSANLTVEPVRPDYRQLLASAACSVSLCGYNTAVDVARCATPALLIPSEEAGEREQTIRATRLAQFPGIRLMRMGDAAPALLAEAAEALAILPPRPKIPLRGDDGTAAIRKIADLAGAAVRP